MALAAKPMRQIKLAPAPSPTLSVYIAGPCFTEAELAFNDALAWDLRRWGLEVYVPQEFAADAAFNKEWDLVRYRCMKFLEQADLVVAILDGPDIDSGTAYEIAKATSDGRQVFAVRTDFRPAENGLGNCMITEDPRVKCFKSGNALREAIRTWIPTQIVQRVEANGSMKNGSVLNGGGWVIKPGGA